MCTKQLLHTALINIFVIKRTILRNIQRKSPDFRGLRKSKNCILRCKRAIIA